MNGPTLQVEAGWSRARWAVVVAWLVIGQVLVAWWVTRWPKLAPPIADGNSLFQLEFPGLGRGAAAVDPLMEDPRQFAFADPQGFSGTASRALPTVEYPLAEWPVQSHWLGAAPQPGRLGAAPAGKALPAPWPNLPTPSLLASAATAPLLVATNSTVIPRGTLAGRPLLNASPPPVLSGLEVLGPTVVEVGVTAAGEVLISRVTRTSGNPVADQLALAWARSAHFSGNEVEVVGRTVETDPLTWGELAFVWRVEPPSR